MTCISRRQPASCLTHLQFSLTDINIESEDEVSADSSDSEAPVFAPKGKGKKPMTARQAVLASVAGSSQIKLCESCSVHSVLFYGGQFKRPGSGVYLLRCLVVRCRGNV